MHATACQNQPANKLFRHRTHTAANDSALLVVCYRCGGCASMQGNLSGNPCREQQRYLWPVALIDMQSIAESFACSGETEYSYLISTCFTCLAARLLRWQDTTPVMPCSSCPPPGMCAMVPFFFLFRRGAEGQANKSRIQKCCTFSMGIALYSCFITTHSPHPLLDLATLQLPKPERPSIFGPKTPSSDLTTP